AILMIRRVREVFRVEWNIVFFFSSRRRHTRCLSDWSSDVCSSDLTKTKVDQKDYGYTIGGPVPFGRSKLFFFVAEEFQPRTTSGALTRLRLPTELERQGDFSQTRDNNGALLNLIRDASTGLPCTAADTRGCFQDGG